MKLTEKQVMGVAVSAVILAVVLGILFYGSIGYVLAHFVKKVW